jgi:hypothetical protein
VTKTPITNESKKWIYEKLTGRFSIIPVTGFYITDTTDFNSKFPAFEDPSEATFYELTWS